MRWSDPCGDAGRLAETTSPPLEESCSLGRSTSNSASAKFLVGQVPTCTNGATTWALSQPGTRRNCITSKDARYPRQDGKTPEPLLQLGVGFWYALCRIGGSLGSPDASSGGGNLEIPLFAFWDSNPGP